MVRKLYRSFSDEINTRTFHCIVPISYFRQIPEEFTEERTTKEFVGGKYGVPTEITYYQSVPTPTSFYNPLNPNQREDTRITIPDMVDLYIKNTFCEIVSDLDVMHILHLIDEYLVEVEDYVAKRDSVFVNFAKKLIGFRQDFIYPCFKRNIVKYPQLLEKYKTYNTGMSKNLLKMFSLDGNNFGYKDGVEKLKNPPYSLDRYIVDKKETKTVKNIDGEDVAPREEDDFMNTLFINWNSK